MITLAWRNLWRQPRRTLLTVSAIAFASVVMVFLLALQVGTYASMKANTLSLFDGFAQIQQPGYLDDPGIRKSFPDADVLAAKLDRLPAVTAVALRAQTYALLTHGRQSIATMVVGVQPDQERHVSRIAATVREGHYLDRPDAASVVLGSTLARNLHVTPGEQVTLLGVGRDGSVAADVLTVVGIFSTGVSELDHQLAEMPLTRFQADFGMPGQAHVAVLGGPSLASMTRALPSIQEQVRVAGLAVRGWAQLEPDLRDAIHLDASTSMLWYIALVVVAIVILLNAILMSVLERTREFGTLLALGMRPTAIGRMVWIEILMMVGLGLALGMGVGAALVGWYQIHGLALPGAQGVFAQWGLPGLIYPDLTLFSLCAGPAAIACIAGLAGLYPLLRIRRLQPVPAMRAV